MHCFWDILETCQVFIDNVTVQHATGSHGILHSPNLEKKSPIKGTFNRDGSDFVNVRRSL